MEKVIQIAIKAGATDLMILTSEGRVFERDMINNQQVWIETSLPELHA